MLVVFSVITFPGSYHFGFNTGFNIAESTNFAVPEWVPHGEAAGICMCHPHSVRIQMKRLKSLLDSYEKDACQRESEGLAPLSYSNWAKREAKRARKEARLGDAGRDTTSASNAPPVAAANSKSFPVKITKESISPRKTAGAKRKSFKRKEVNEWRLAKRGRPGLFVPNAKVICMVECEDANGPDYESFIGTVVKIVDGHIKVHMTGLGKKDDMWFEQGSDLLFLDGGVTEAPTEALGAKKKL